MIGIGLTLPNYRGTATPSNIIDVVDQIAGEVMAKVQQ